jgi:subfamily B ATP-binding cassette protein MsbA
MTKAKPPVKVPYISPPIWETYKRLLTYVWPMWWLFCVSIFGFMLFSAAQVLLSDVIQLIVDTIAGNPNQGKGIISSAIKLVSSAPLDVKSASIWICSSIVVLGAFRGLGFFMGNYYLQSVARMLMHDMRCEIFNHLLYSPSARFDQNSSGSLISIIIYTSGQVTAAATNALKTVLREGLYSIGLLGYLFYQNWKLTLVFLVSMPFIALISLALGQRFRRYSKRIQDSMGEVSQVANEAIQGYREVRMFGGTDRERERFAQASETNINQSMRLAFYNALGPVLIQQPLTIAVAVLVWIGLSYAQNMSPGEFVAYLTVAMLLPKSIRQISEVNGVIQKGVAAAESIFEFIDSEREVDQGTYTAERVSGKIEIRDLNFAYATSESPVLKNINLTIEPGQTVALVGLSGSGKSTLVSLLSRFYDHTQGEILIDGVDVNAFVLANLRSHIGLVTQQVVLFNDTVANNIAYGSLRDSSRELIEKVAEDAHATEFISALPNGLDTFIGENGVMLSGGQRQRLAIARALLKDAPILILDEATSALDNRAEAHIQAALDLVMKNRTTIVIAHRLSTIENADLIVVMEAGEIIEQGTHAELMKRHSRYAELHNKSFSD